MITHLDRYYTPPKIADRVVEASGLVTTPNSCVDSSCGRGSLLFAAERAFGPPVQCIGLEKDRFTLDRLRQQRPNWLLFERDILVDEVSTFQPGIEGPSADVLLLNPPFSLGARKNVEVVYRSQTLHVSTAMAHVLRSADLLKPTGPIVAIVPESLLYSETDRAARFALEQRYVLKVERELRNTTFRGARTNAAIVTWAPRVPTKKRNQLRSLGRGGAGAAFRIVRGGLPVFQADFAPDGLEYVHTVDLSRLANGEGSGRRSVKQIGRGVVEGPVLLFPRVGVPRQSAFPCLHLVEPVQLSDCVIALSFDSLKLAQQAQRRILGEWDDFVCLFRGTGARYVTLGRLQDWTRQVMG